MFPKLFIHHFLFSYRSAETGHTFWSGTNCNIVKSSGCLISDSVNWWVLQRKWAANRFQKYNLRCKLRNLSSYRACVSYFLHYSNRVDVIFGSTVFTKNIQNLQKPHKSYFVAKPELGQTNKQLQHSVVLHVKTEAAIQRCSLKKIFWKYVANLQENTHAEVWF